MEQFFYQCEKNGCFLEQYVYHIGSYHYNWHRELELMTVLRGELEVCIDGASHLLRDSDVILIGSNKGHATLARQPQSVAMVLHIAPDLFREDYGDMDALQFTCCSEGGRKNERPFVLLRAHLASLMLSAQGQGTEEKLRFESALSHGFSDLKSFNTVFRARFSKTPTEYRRQLNETVTKYDPRFKRDFLPRADEAMNQILLQYMLDPGQPAEQPPAGADTPLQRVAETSLRLKELTQGLPQTAAGLEKILWELSQ